MSKRVLCNAQRFKIIKGKDFGADGTDISLQAWKTRSLVFPIPSTMNSYVNWPTTQNKDNWVIKICIFFFSISDILLHFSVHILCFKKYLFASQVQIGQPYILNNPWNVEFL